MSYWRKGDDNEMADLEAMMESAKAFAKGLLIAMAIMAICLSVTYAFVKGV